MFNTFNATGLQQAGQAYNAGGSNPLINILTGAQAAGYGGMASAANYGNSLEAQREGLLNNLLGLQSTGGIQGQAAKEANQIQENAFNTGNQGAMAMKGMGYGSGAAGGLMGSLLGEGAAQTNASNQRFADPNYVSSVLQNAYGTIGAGMSNPLLSQALTYEGPIMGQNQFNYATQGQGLLGSIAPILGSFSGGSGGSSLLAGLFGGGAGGQSGGAGGSGMSALWPGIGAGEYANASGLGSGLTALGW